MFAAMRSVKVIVSCCGILSAAGVLADRASAQMTWHLQHAGTVFDAFTLNGNEVWTVEDGGRMRHRTGTTQSYTWDFFPNIPSQDLLYRVDFLDNGLLGWACGLEGWFMTLTNNGITHPSPFQLGGPTGHLKFWDVKFLDADNGWLLEEHALYQTTTGGDTALDWSRNNILFLDKQGHQLLQADLQLLKFYALDIVPVPPGGPTSILGLACAEPGLIFRSTDGAVWQEVFDIRD